MTSPGSNRPPTSTTLRASIGLVFSADASAAKRGAGRMPMATIAICAILCLKAGLKLTDANAPIIADICRRLDGIALAIELAAGRIDAFGLRELAARLDDRFRLLTRGRRTALPRHQTLSATLDWSHELLLESERVVLRRLAVFAGSFTLPAASTVASSGDVAASDVADCVANL